MGESPKKKEARSTRGSHLQTKAKSTTVTQITRSADTGSQPTVGPTQVKRTKDPKQGRYVKLWEGRI